MPNAISAGSCQSLGRCKMHQIKHAWLINTEAQNFVRKINIQHIHSKASFAMFAVLLVLEMRKHVSDQIFRTTAHFHFSNTWAFAGRYSPPFFPIIHFLVKAIPRPELWIHFHMGKLHAASPPPDRHVQFWIQMGAAQAILSIEPKCPHRSLKPLALTGNWIGGRRSGAETHE